MHLSASLSRVRIRAESRARVFSELGGGLVLGRVENIERELNTVFSLSAGVALRSRAAAVARESALAVAVARFAVHAHSGVRSAAQARALTNRVALAVVGVGVSVGRGVGVGVGVGRSKVRASSSVQSGARVLVAQHAAVLGVVRAAISLGSAVTVAEASSTVGFVATHGSPSRKRSAALGSNARDVVVSSISSRSVASAVASTVSRSIARTVAAVSSVVPGGSSHAIVVRVQGQGRVSQARVVRAVGELASASVPSVGSLALACALLLHVVARVQLAVVSRGARLGVREAGAASGILRSGRGGGDQVSVAIRLSTISAPIPIAGDIVGVGVSPEGTLVELHGGSHVHVLLPSLLRKFLSSDHGKGSSEGNGGVIA